MEPARLLVLYALLVLTPDCAEAPKPVPHREVTGRVVADHDGTPIPGARVVCQGKNAVTAPDGTFAVSIPVDDRPGHIDILRVTAEGFGKSRPHTDRNGPVVIRLKKSFSVSGRVVDAKGRPVPDATVLVRGAYVSQSPYFDASYRKQATTARDGSFRVEGISRELTFQHLTVEADGYGSPPLPVRIDPDPKRDGLDVGKVRIDAASAIRLLVLGPDGEPMPDTHVTLAGRFSREIETDAEGTARFDGVAPGLHRLIASPRGLPPMTVHVEVPAAGRTVEATLRPPFDRTITFLVRDPEGRPVVGAVVGGWLTSRQTGKDGRVTLRALPETAARCGVRAWKQGLFRMLVGPFIPAGQEVTITLRPTSTITGRVVGSDGSPVSGVGIRAKDPRIRGYASGLSDADGRFRIEVPGGMPLHLEALQRRPRTGPARWKAGRQPPKAHGSVDGVVAPAKDVRIVLSELPVNVSLTAVVLDPDGAPLQGAEVFVNGSGSRSFTDAHGRRGIAGLVGWRTELSTWLPRGRTDLVAPAPVVVIPADKDVVLRARKAKVLRGTVRRPDGSPADRAEIEVVTEDGVLIRARSDDEGRFAVSLLPGRPHSLKVRFRTPEAFECHGYREGVVPGAGELDLVVVPGHG